MVQGSNPGGAWFSAPVQSGPGTQPASYMMNIGSLFRGVKRPGRGVNHVPSSSAEVKERVQQYLYSPFGPSREVTGWLYLYFNLPLSLQQYFAHPQPTLHTLTITALLAISHPPPSTHASCDLPGCTHFGRQVPRATRFRAVAPGILSCLLWFWKFCGPLLSRT
jgi:hypothetical protein